MNDRKTFAGSRGMVRRMSVMTILAIVVVAALVGACQSASERAEWVDQFSSLQGATEAVVLALPPGSSIAAAPSPDGSRIVFAAQGALWVMPLVGGDPVRITQPDLQPAAPVWSPDGQTIAFENYATQGSHHIWTIAPDGSRPTPVTAGPNDDRDPAWLPDASGLVFASDRSNDGQYKIWRVAPGSAPVQVTTGPGSESKPSVSPDGGRLAYVNGTNVMTASLDGSAVKLVAKGTAPAWSRGGLDLVYQNANRQLVLGGQQLTTNEDYFPFPVRFLPDGRFLYTADGKIRLRDAAGANPQNVEFHAELIARQPVIARR